MRRTCYGRDDDTPAIIFRNERGERRELSWRQLRSEVARIASGLKKLGIKPGDRVAGYLPNVPETVIAMLATTSVGAIWSSCSPDFGASAVVDRFGQIKPRVLFAADGYFYAGKTIDRMPVLREICKHITSIEGVVLVPYVRPDLAADKFAHAVAVQGLRQCRRASVVRAAAVRAAGVHFVFLRHDGRAQVHRAQCRRRADSTAERTHPAHGHGSAGSIFLFHHLRLGDVERAGERPRHRRHDRAVRRRTAAAGSAHPVAPGVRRTHHDLRHQPTIPCDMRTARHTARARNST